MNDAVRVLWSKVCNDYGRYGRCEHPACQRAAAAAESVQALIEDYARLSAMLSHPPLSVAQ